LTLGPEAEATQRRGMAPGASLASNLKTKSLGGHMPSIPSIVFVIVCVLVGILTYEVLVK